MNRLLRWLLGKSSNGQDGRRQTAAPLGPEWRTRPVAESPPVPPPDGRARSVEEARAYRDRVTEKMHRLAEEFANGTINRAQFERLFEHYQRERKAIQAWLDSQEQPEDWRQAVQEGKSVVIRARHVARVLGYAIYRNDSGMPLCTIGKFDLDPALAVPMLSAYRSAAQEIFGGGVRSTQVESGQWLTFIPGEFTTLLAIFSTEPARAQLARLEELHRIFERANRERLAQGATDTHGLVFPHYHYLGRLS